MNTKVVVDTKRLAAITVLASGGHVEGSESMCAMEAAAYIAREPWTDHPECVDPVIGVFMRSWNDALPDGERTAILLPLIPKTIGTRGSAKLSERRSLMAADWLVRVNTPAWLRLAGLTVHADALAALPEITDMAQVPSIRGPIEAARVDADAAWDAARNAAAWDAAWAAAAWAAAWDAARNAAAWDAAWAAAAWAAAWAAARAAAWDAARAAARAAARDVANSKLAATKAELQQSAVALVERMCALTEEALPEAA